MNFTSPHTRYPVLGQLFILGFALMLVFSGIFFTRTSAEPAPSYNHVQSLPAEERVLTRSQPSSVAGAFIVPETQAEAIMVYDVNADEVIYARNADTPLPLASITKLMTALVVTELLTSDTSVTITPEAVAQYGQSGLYEGETVTAQNLIEYALLASSNDAAYALAVSLGEKLIPGEGSGAFVDAMNLRARELELESIMFQNPTGLDVTNFESAAQGSARDVNTLMRYLLTTHPELLLPTRSDSARIQTEVGRYLDIRNTNRIIPRIPNLLGSKTGYTELAGGNLTIAFDTGYNRPIIITVLGSTFTGRFEDVAALVDATREAFHNID